MNCIESALVSRELINFAAVRVIDLLSWPCIHACVKPFVGY